MSTEALHGVVAVLHDTGGMVSDEELRYQMVSVRAFSEGEVSEAIEALLERQSISRENGGYELTHAGEIELGGADIARTSRSKPNFKPKKCSVCGAEFKPTAARQIKCDECKAKPPQPGKPSTDFDPGKLSVCANCTGTFVKTSDDQRYCSDLCFKAVERERLRHSHERATQQAPQMNITEFAAAIARRERLLELASELIQIQTPSLSLVDALEELLMEERES